ncbi:MAG: type II toxin-antitoxin system PemK/MazF family toxin [Lachnospiraceae bacterium]|nr:type II toxin-antitoxin system PemK/MazF family toxin [Ruminococcus sp.]MCM1275806.1 type II toxin-antitoxin system PemK/MazF family toxin [Lachnospiraceae bacterium]
MTDLEIALNDLKNTILNKPPKKQQILTQWLKKWCVFLRREDNFNPKFLPFYKRGDIVYADFGFNVGAEFGGIHYAVVIENNNNKSNGNIVVVPLTSLDPGKSVEDIPKTDVYIGDNIIGWTNSATIAKPNQIRAISKIRICKPTTPKDKKATLNGSQLQLIDDKLDQIIKKQA